MAETANGDRPAPRLATSLTDLVTKTVKIEIELLDGEIFIVEIRLLSIQEWDLIGKEIPQPVAPSRGTSRGLEYDTNNPDYLKAVEEANFQREARRVAAAIVTPIPGETVADKASWLLTQLDMGIYNALRNKFWEIHLGRRAEVATRAATFHNG